MIRDSTKPDNYYEHRIFGHHLYEYNKGLRDLVLFTARASSRDAIEKSLDKKKVAYHVQKVNEGRVNVFFGDRLCIDVVKQMSLKSLSDLSDEEDFILGVMLGYNRLQQCERYLGRKNKGKERKETKNPPEANVNLKNGTGRSSYRLKTGHDQALKIPIP